MKTYISLLMAIAAFTSPPAFPQQEGQTFDSKTCDARCKEITKPEDIKKDVYDHRAVQGDPSKSEAEKARSHKDAVKKVCRSICYEN
jgi:hypothetical protein